MDASRHLRFMLGHKVVKSPSRKQRAPSPTRGTTPSTRGTTPQATPSNANSAGYLAPMTLDIGLQDYEAVAGPPGPPGSVGSPPMPTHSGMSNSMSVVGVVGEVKALTRLPAMPAHGLGSREKLPHHPEPPTIPSPRRPSSQQQHSRRPSAEERSRSPGGTADQGGEASAQRSASEMNKRSSTSRDGWLQKRHTPPVRPTAPLSRPASFGGSRATAPSLIKSPIIFDIALPPSASPSKAPIVPVVLDPSADPLDTRASSAGGGSPGRGRGGGAAGAGVGAGASTLDLGSQVSALPASGTLSGASMARCVNGRVSHSPSPPRSPPTSPTPGGVSNNEPAPPPPSPPSPTTKAEGSRSIPHIGSKHDGSIPPTPSMEFDTGVVFSRAGTPGGSRPTTVQWHPSVLPLKPYPHAAPVTTQRYGLRSTAPFVAGGAFSGAWGRPRAAPAMVRLSPMAGGLSGQLPTAGGMRPQRAAQHGLGSPTRARTSREEQMRSHGWVARQIERHAPGYQPIVQLSRSSSAPTMGLLTFG